LIYLPRSSSLDHPFDPSSSSILHFQLKPLKSNLPRQRNTQEQLKTAQKSTDAMIEKMHAHVAHSLISKSHKQAH